MMLDFTDPALGDAEQARWYAVDDGVMGGVSHSGFRVEEGHGCFYGEVSLENGGGFASVRREPGTFEPSLAQAKGITLRVRGDGRRYQLRLKSHALDDASAYRVAFTPSAQQWETLHSAGRSSTPCAGGRCCPTRRRSSPAPFTSWAF